MTDTQDAAEVLQNLVPALQTLKEKEPEKYVELLKKITKEVEEMTKILD